MIVLATPFNTMTTTMTLKNPEWSDTETVDVQVEVHTMMSGRIKTYKKTAPLHKLKLTFEDCDRADAMRARNFLIAAAGNDVRLVDWKGDVWQGIITTTADEIETVGRGRGIVNGRAEANTIVLEFEGRRL